MIVLLFLLMLCNVQALLASPPDWQVNPALFQHSASVIAQMQYNNNDIPSGNVIIGAFAGNELRGKAMPITYGTGKYFFVTVYTNSVLEIITFKAYIENIDTILTPLEQLSIEPNGVYGSMAHPYGLQVFFIAAPAAYQADSVTTTSFTAKWGSVPEAGSYRLDVSTFESFSSAGAPSFLEGYNNKTISSLSETVTGLSAGTTYYYRVRSIGQFDTSRNSATIAATTAAQSITAQVTGIGIQAVPVPGTSGVSGINIGNVISPGNLLVYYFTTPPANHNLTGIVSSYRWVISPDNALAINQADGYTIKFKSIDCPGLVELPEGDAASFKLYKRSTPGSGDFSDVGFLTYHRNGTDGDQSDDYLLSALITNGFSEFVFVQTAASTLTVTALIEGLYNGAAMASDTITVALRNAVQPYSQISETRGLTNSSGQVSATFSMIPDATPFYIVIKHRSSIETWSAEAQSFSGRALLYDFSVDSTKAFGNNLRKKNGKWCILSGDVNQDGFVDFTDLTMVDNASAMFLSGYRPEDVDGNNFTDMSDLIIVDNSAYHYSMVQSPEYPVSRAVPNPVKRHSGR
ncbi:MAG: hypothetical protein HYV28_15255 [Ignavibacteriales bacterium]|nr:hypothetical protein [Ignavibacteriales bacterium]